MDDLARLGVLIDTQTAKTGRKDMDAFTASSGRAEKATRDLSRTTKTATTVTSQATRTIVQAGAANNNFAFQSRMAAMQLSQVAQQTMASGNFIRALSIQLPDLALGFGAVGIAAGVAAGVILPLAVDFITGGDNAKAFKDSLDDLSGATDRYLNVSAEARRTTQDLATEFGGMADEAQRAFRIVEGLALANAMNALNVSIETLDVSGLETFVNIIRQGPAELEVLNDTFNRSLEALRDDFGLTGDQAIALVQKLDLIKTAQGPEALVRAADDLNQYLIQAFGSAQNIPPEIREMVQNLAEAQTVAARIVATMDGSADAATRAANSAGGVANQLNVAANQAIALRNALVSADAAIGAIGLDVERKIATIKARNLAIQKGQNEAVAGEVALLQQKVGEQTKALVKGGASLDQAVEQTQAVRDQVKEYSGLLSQNDKLQKAQQATTKAAQATGAAASKSMKEAERATQQARREAERLAEAYQNQVNAPIIGAIDGMAGAFGDFLTLSGDGIKGLGETIIGTIQGSISQAIAFAIANPIKLALGVGGLAGGSGLGSGGAAGGGAGGGLINGLLGKVGGLFGGVSAGAQAALGLGGFTSAGLFNVTANAATAAATGVGAFSASIGAALPVIGIAAAAFSFFKSKTTDLDAGLRVLIDGLNEATVNTYLLQEKTRFWGLSKKTIETETLANATVADPIQAAVDKIGQTVFGLSDTLGLASDNLDNVAFEFDVSTRGKTDEEIQRAIATEMARLGDTFAEAVLGSYTEFLPDEAAIAEIDRRIAATYNIGGEGGAGLGAERRAILEQERLAAQTAIEIVHVNDAFSGLILEGEGTLAALQRVVGELQGVNEILYLFDRAALDMSLSGATAASTLAQLAGGLEAFTAKSQFVFENFLTSSDQETRLIEIAGQRLTQTFGDLQFAIPATHAEFMALLNVQDLNTAAGRETYSALMDVAQAFVTVNGTAQGAVDGLNAVANAQADLRRSEVDAAQAVLNARARAAEQALRDAESGLRNAFGAERDRLSENYDQAIDAAQAAADAATQQAEAARFTAQERVVLRQGIVDALEGAYRDRRVITAAGEQLRLSQASAFLRSARDAGGTSDIDRLESALDTVADPSKSLFTSFADYQLAFSVNTNLIEELKDLSGDSLSIEQRMLNAAEGQIAAIDDGVGRQVLAIEQARDDELTALDAQLAALLGLDTSVMTVAEAIANLRSAQATDENSRVTTSDGTAFASGSFGDRLNQAYQDNLGRDVRQAGLGFYGGVYQSAGSSEEAWQTILDDISQSAEAQRFRETGVPMFAAGGAHMGGARIVGERGPELEVTGPSRIVSASETRSIFNNQPIIDLLREMLTLSKDKDQRMERMQMDLQRLRSIETERQASEAAAT